MPPFIVDNRVDTLEMKEKNGVIRSMTRVARISGLGANVDHGVLLAAYAMVGLPTPGSFMVNPPLNPNIAAPPGPGSGHAMLVLADRTFKLVEQDKATVDVHMVWEHFMDGDNQNLGGINSPTITSPNGWSVPFSRIVYGKNRASVQQTKSNFYDSRKVVPAFNPFGSYTNGDVVDYQGIYWVAVALIEVHPPEVQLPPPPGPAGTPIGELWFPFPEDLLEDALPAPGVRRQIVVGHQFPETDRQFRGQTKYQTGEITVMQPNDNFKLHGQVFIRNPRDIKRRLLGAINSVPWMDGNAYEWMCTEVTWEPLYVSWQWRMSFEFQHNEDTWLPTAIFHDQRDGGKPPAGLLEGFGHRTLHKQPEIDFERYFGAVFGCAPMAGA